MGIISKIPVSEPVAAVSVGIVNGEALLDLNYAEDSEAELDMNLVMTGKGEFVEIGATGEENTFSQEDFNKMLEYGKSGIERLIKIQKEFIEGIPSIGHWERKDIKEFVYKE